MPSAPWLDDGDVRLYHGDALGVLATLPPRSVQTCVTSPPYWGLRDYGTGSWTGGSADCDHTRQSAVSRASSGLDGATTTQGGVYAYGDKCGHCGARRVDDQLGLEATPDAYVERLVLVMREVWRVLRADGTLFLNLGDSYAGSASQGGPSEKQQSNAGSWHDAARPMPPGLKPKDLCGIPWRVAFALQADGWYLRSDIIWAKPNPMPESVTDRPTKAHEYVFLLAKQPRYYWDADAIRETAIHEGRVRRATGGDSKNGRAPDEVNDRRTATGFTTHDTTVSGRNARSVWEIATQPSPEAHFATYPEALVRRCILAGTSEVGQCIECGSPWRRVPRDGSDAWRGSGPRQEYRGFEPSCAHGAPSVDQIVLDPFVGSGTTALVARKHGRRAIGIDLSEEYLRIAARRTSQLSLLGDAPQGAEQRDASPRPCKQERQGCGVTLAPRAMTTRTAYGYAKGSAPQGAPKRCRRCEQPTPHTYGRGLCARCYLHAGGV